LSLIVHSVSPVLLWISWAPIINNSSNLVSATDFVCMYLLVFSCCKDPLGAKNMGGKV